MRRNYDIPNTIHALTFSCFKSLKLLSHDRFRYYLIDSIEISRLKHNFNLIAWVIMPTHVHLIIHPMNPEYSIAKILKSIKLPVSQRTIIYLQNINSPALNKLDAGIASQKYRFWQNGGGYDRNIRDLDELFKLIHYIHNNPVKAGLVESPVDWEWSSARDWLMGVEGKIRIDKYDLI